MKNKKLSKGDIDTLISMSQMAEWYIMKAREDKYINYKHEAGMLVSENDTAINIITGGVGHVDFPEELIWDLHKHRPGYLLKLAHTHPPRMDNPSARDIQTLETWAWALYPFPIRLSVITLWDRDKFVEKSYMTIIQPKEIWVEQGKNKREVKTFLETQRFFRPSLLNKGETDDMWLLQLIEESYGKDGPN